MRTQRGRNFAAILAILVMAQYAVAKGELTQEQDDAVKSLALKTWAASGLWTASGFLLGSASEHCDAALEEITGKKQSYEPCLTFLREKDVKKVGRDTVKILESEGNYPEIVRAAAPAYTPEREEVRVLKEKESKASAIALSFENGDQSAVNSCYRNTNGGDTDSEFRDICIKKVNESYYKALRANKVDPKNCAQWGYVNTRDGETIPSIIRVSIGSGSHLGSFSGEITQIDGKTIVVYDKASRLNAIVILDNKTKIYDPNLVAVGLAATGIGMQTGSRQVKLATGQGSTVAVISAKCIEGQPNY